MSTEMPDHIIVLGTSEFQWLMRPFGLLLEKYCPSFKVRYFSDKQVADLPINIEFVTLPGLSGDKWDWMSDFGGGFRAILESLEEPNPFICLPDMWLRGTPDLVQLKALNEFLSSHSGFLLRLFVGNDAGLGAAENDQTFCGSVGESRV